MKAPADGARNQAARLNDRERQWYTVSLDTRDAVLPPHEAMMRDPVQDNLRHRQAMPFDDGMDRCESGRNKQVLAARKQAHIYRAGDYLQQRRVPCLCWGSKRDSPSVNRGVGLVYPPVTSPPTAQYKPSDSRQKHGARSEARNCYMPQRQLPGRCEACNRAVCMAVKEYKELVNQAYQSDHPVIAITCSLSSHADRVAQQVDSVFTTKCSPVLTYFVVEWYPYIST
ncbi:hypothetical protein DFH07DRAFT_764314 [Mycena maculata]|uniref:Uncharacterized protein n=1 Tax=Mycena maculata TaxID=230809 RepID=A0AAD7KEH2_9AGAR|nr:hypothetical protein DFH07DRAFT_764314 [Mycena maculata]